MLATTDAAPKEEQRGREYGGRCEAAEAPGLTRPIALVVHAASGAVHGRSTGRSYHKHRAVGAGLRSASARFLSGSWPIPPLQEPGPQEHENP